MGVQISQGKRKKTPFVQQCSHVRKIFSYKKFRFDFLLMTIIMLNLERFIY